MQSRVSVGRAYGERLGHLSRHGQRELLCSELEGLRAIVQKGIDGYAFRKAFVGAGGWERDWERLVAPVVKTSTVRRRAPAPRTAVAEPEDDGLLQALAAVPDPDQPEAPRHEAVDASEADADPWAGRPCETVPASDRCNLILCEISRHVLGVKVQGVFGAGGHGGGQLIEQIRQAVDQGVSAVLLDLSGIEALRIDGTAPLVACQVSVERVGGHLTLVAPPGAAGGLLEATGLARR
ncbi:MAG: STAS domain-containing protein, partial [Armatimonadota bacterium]